MRVKSLPTCAISCRYHRSLWQQAYIYVLNVIGAKGDRVLDIIKDLLIETVVGTFSFVLITVLLLGQYYVISLLLRK